MTALTHHCSECGHAIGFMGEPYLCHRTGRHAQPHIPMRRKTPRPPAPQTGPSPSLAELLKENRWRPRRHDHAAMASYPFLPSSRRAAEAVADDNLAATAPARTTTISADTGKTRRERGISR